MAQIKDEMIHYITREEIHAMIQTLAKDIEQDYEGKELVMICPLKG